MHPDGRAEEAHSAAAISNHTSRFGVERFVSDEANLRVFHKPTNQRELSDVAEFFRNGWRYVF